MEDTVTETEAEASVSSYKILMATYGRKGIQTQGTKRLQQQNSRPVHTIANGEL